MSAQAVAFPAHPATNPAQNLPKPRKLNARQEEFCNAYVLLGNGAKAAFRAGYSPHAARQQAARLLTNANILERIAELRRDLGLRNKIDRDTVMAKLEAAYRGALNAGNYLSAVRAAEAQARLAGLYPEREGAGVPAGAKKSGADGEFKQPNGNGSAKSTAPQPNLVPSDACR